MTGGTDTYPVWTVRFTWRVTRRSDEPLRTYDGAQDECQAVDRAVFVLDHYQDSAVRELVCVHVKRPDGSWSEVSRSAAGVLPARSFAFQRAPVRPAFPSVKGNAHDHRG